MCLNLSPQRKRPLADARGLRAQRRVLGALGANNELGGHSGHVPYLATRVYIPAALSAIRDLFFVRAGQATTTTVSCQRCPPQLVVTVAVPGRRARHVPSTVPSGPSAEAQARTASSDVRSDCQAFRAGSVLTR